MLDSKLIFVFLSIFLGSCHQKHSKAAKPAIQGIWKKHGYGQIIRINKSEIGFYDITQKSCLPVKSISLKNIKELGEIIKLTSD